ncbi:MAG: thioredoxin domain-containing protein [Verrucomicrobia bacterium]|nr:thioredoxin domain-containing protein [Verrucomicrobiota bacterium]
MTEQYTNHLAGQSSPYLQQHVHNPVDWYPWGQEAFDRAKEEDRPIFLSIGYATCHWCHVMEKESFNNVAIARLMNATFVNVKVDREELPQVDSLYMEVAQAMMGGGGGWPLNLVLTPDLKPLFAATYMPPDEGRETLSLPQLIERMGKLWSSPEREGLLEQAEQLLLAMNSHESPPSQVIDAEGLISGLAEIYYKLADPISGGMQGEPKFPMPFHLNFMLRIEDTRALFYASKTLEMMHRGGIYDHLGGGFSRYAVDADWLIPHFEKMLYDNALIVFAYIEGWQKSQNPLFKEVAEETLHYLSSVMRHPDGAFYSAQDADTEGQEGLFYTWTREEISHVLGEQEGRLFQEFYNVDAEGNFEAGRSVLYQEMSVEDFARRHRLDPLQFPEQLAKWRHQLWLAREKRTRPFCDDKIIVGWNGLAIRAFAEAAFAFSNETYLSIATACSDFIRRNMWVGGHLLRRWRQGEVGLAACLEDYAYLISGLLSLFKAQGGSHYLAWAIQLCNVLSSEFKQEEGAFFRTDGKDPYLLVRQVELYDAAEPSGNAVHCENLIRLYQITGAERFLVEAEEIFQRSEAFLQQFPLAGTYHCLALQRYLNAKAPTLVIALNAEQNGRKEILKSLGSKHAPNAEVIWRSQDDEQLTRLVPLCRDQVPIEGQTTLYLCHQGRCEKPLHQLPEILEKISQLST